MPVPQERQNFADKPRFALGSLVTYTEQPSVEFTGENANVSHEVKDPDITPPTETVTIGARSLSIDGTAFTDEIAALDRMRLAGDSVRVRHAIFFTPAVKIDALTCRSEPGLGSDGSGQHRTRASFSIDVTETADEGSTPPNGANE